jgi:regulatory protein
VKKNSRPTFDSPTDDPARVESEARRVALGLLARREHSSLELAYKLSARGFDADRVASLLHRLSAEGLLSDARFAESFVRARRDKGYGPVRIRGELRERGVDSETIEACLDQSDVAWLRLVASVRAKRFGLDLPGDFRERARQTRFLQQRGFTVEQIRGVLADTEP